MRLGSLAWWGSALVRGKNEAIRWEELEKWLFRVYRPRIARERLSYARKFSHCLVNQNLSELQSLSINKRLHVMKALSALAKFLGVYENFKALIKSYGLKWNVNSDDLIIRRLVKIKEPNEIFDWIRTMKRTKPGLSSFLDFMALTGLRFNEALESYNLIVKLHREEKLGQYYDSQREVLEHFRFKEIFIRRTKKAFISFAPKALVEAIAEQPPLSHSAARSPRKKGIKLRFGDIREAHASLLTKHLNQAEIDFLHGRVSTSVFMRNYFNPALIGDLKDRIFMAMAEVQTSVNS